MAGQHNTVVFPQQMKCLGTGSCKHQRTITTSLHRTALSIRRQRRHILVHAGDILQPDFHFRLPSVDGEIHRAE